MASITTRQTAGVGATVAGAPLTNAQVDTNFINLNAEVYIDNFPTVKPSLMLDFANSDVVDSRITFTRSTVATYYDALGVLQTAPINIPRLDHDPVTLEPLGLLMEEARTNTVRNSTVSGAVTGTPGTVPTYWTQFSPLTGLTRTIVGTGVEKGVSYIDVQFSGTASAAGPVSVQFEASASALFTAGTTVTGSVWCALVGGSTTNVTSTSLRLMSYLSTTYLSESGVAMSLTSTLTRFTNTYTTAATSDRVSFVVSINVAAAGALDITIRIGMPQLEQGAFATSIIPTTTAALARATDAAMVNTLTPWFNSLEYTLYYEGSVKTFGTGQTFLGVGDTFDNTAYMSRGTATQFNGAVRSGAASTAQMLVTTTPASGSVFKSAQAVKLNDFAATINGITPVVDTVGVLPSSNVRLSIGGAPFAATGGNSGQQWVRRIAHYPRRLSNLELQAITS